MSKNAIKKLVEKLNVKVNELDAAGRKWIGYDGLLNMETFALITLFFTIFLPSLISAGCAFVIAAFKCICDKKKGRTNEKHDFICAGIGIIFGCILGIGISI